MNFLIFLLGVVGLVMFVILTVIGMSLYHTITILNGVL